MCGRYTLSTPSDELVRILGLEEIPDWAPRYNIAPTQTVLAVRNESGHRRAAPMRWGLVPSWSKDVKSGPPLINARSETARQKPAFRTRTARGRCLMPADGFYEWKTAGTAKQPFLFLYPGQAPFAFAALWDTWRKPNDEPLESCCILTTSAQGWISEFHDRMPVILPESEWPAWLEAGEIDEAHWNRLCSAFPAQSMSARKVSTRINRVSEDSPACTEELTESAADRKRPLAPRPSKKPIDRPGFHQGELF